MLRGGPMIKTTGSFSQRFGFSTDYRKKLGFEFYFNGNKGFEDTNNNINTGVSINYKPINYLSISLGPGFSKSFNELQYVTTTDFGTDKRYVFASIDRKTVNASLRINLNLSPDLTFQYWGQPFVATGHYYDYKYITTPMAENYADRFQVYSVPQISTNADGYVIDEDLDNIPDYSFENNNFNVQEFLSNLVIRWEYNPGSTVFLVWSQTRSGFNDSGRLDYFDDMGSLFNNKINKNHESIIVGIILVSA
jgi:hypothetical protein